MQFSEHWLRQYVDPALDSQGLSHALTMAGLEVEALEPVAPAFSKVVVAEIISAEKHPDADSMYVEQIELGEAKPRTVCSGLVKFIPLDQVSLFLRHSFLDLIFLLLINL